MTEHVKTNQGGGSSIRAATAAAIADVDALGVEQADRDIVLKAVLEAHLSGFATTSVAPMHGNGVTNKAMQQQTAIADDDVLGKIAQRLNVDRDLVDLVYAMQDGEPQVAISAKKIVSNKAQAARQLGQLVAAARQIAGLEEWTSANTIRPIVSDYGRMDPSNFAAQLQQMDTVALVRGKGQQREVKVTKPGFESTGELIKSLVGGDS